MRRTLTLMSFMAVFASAVLLDSSVARAQAGGAPAGGYRGPTRVDFDDRLIKGQTTKADSVYIYDRQQIEIRSLVTKARTFRPKIIRSVFEE